MLPQQISELQQAQDQELARMVKETHSNEAITEIIDRHTGIYKNVVNGFNIPPMIRNDLLDQVNTNIYKYTLDYDPSKQMKLSSYLYSRTRYECMNSTRGEKVTEEVDENEFSESFSYNDSAAVKDISLKIARAVGGHEFEKVIEARHFGDDSGTVSWHALGLPFSHEKCRTVYQAHIDKFRVECKKQFNYVNIK